MTGRLDVRPFTTEHVDDAGRLLARRHRAHLRHESLLDPRFTDPELCTQQVSAACSSADASGAVAVRGREMVGFLVSSPKPEPIWGANVWVESAGLAVTEPEVARDLYALAAARWVDEGRTAHYVLVPSHDQDLADAWYRLAFGQQHVHAIREPTAGPARAGIRRARRDDVPALAALDLELPRHQARSPVFSSGPMPTLEEALAEAEESIDHPDYTVFVAERDGQVVGCSVACSIETSGSHTGPARPDNAGFLAFGAVLPSARGTGAGRALGEAVLAWSNGSGHRSVVTDWRATNLLSSRAWPRLGFRPTFLRLHRNLGH